MSLVAEEPIAPVIERHSELPGAGLKFEAVSLRCEAEVAPSHDHGRRSRVVARADLAAIAAGRRINAMIEREQQAVHKLLLSVHAKTGEDLFANIRAPVAVRVFQIPDVRSRGHIHAALPRLNPAGPQ